MIQHPIPEMSINSMKDEQEIERKRKGQVLTKEGRVSCCFHSKSSNQTSERIETGLGFSFPCVG